MAGQLLAMPDPVRSCLTQARYWTLFEELAGQSAQQLADTSSTTSPARLPLLMLTPFLVAYEHAMTQGDASKATWRPDKPTTCPHQQAGQYLTFLASIGYQLSAIEQTVADGIPYISTDDGEPDAAQLAQVVTAPDADPGNDQPTDWQSSGEPESCQAA